jgi:phospholipid transport system substrate-binding protein
MRAFLFSLGIILYLLHHPAGISAASENAETVVRKATEEIYQALDEQCELIGQSPEHLYTLVNRLLIPRADFEKMSQWVLGKYWREADDKQRQVFVEQFRQLLIRTYATAIQLANLEDIHYLPQRESIKPDRATVRAEIHRRGDATVSLTYALYQTHGVWLVYDIQVDGVSLVSSYRATFSSEIRSQGLEALLESMKKKNNEAMSETTAHQIRSRKSGSCDKKKQP